jgi:hypothetical protein
MNNAPSAIKAIIIALVLVAIPSSALDLSAGAKFGMNISSILGDTAKGVSPKVGLTGGVFSTVWVTPIIYVQPELMISLMGESSDTDQNVFNPPNATNLAYAEIPVTVGWKFLGHELYQASIYVGVVPSFLLMAQSVYGGGAGSIDMKNKTKSFDCGLTGGATVTIKSNSAFVPIDIRYYLGMVPFNNDKNYPLNNAAVSLTIGFGSEIKFKKEEKF